MARTKTVTMKTLMKDLALTPEEAREGFEGFREYAIALAEAYRRAERAKKSGPTVKAQKPKNLELKQ